MYPLDALHATGFPSEYSPNARDKSLCDQALEAPPAPLNGRLVRHGSHPKKHHRGMNSPSHRAVAATDWSHPCVLQIPVHRYLTDSLPHPARSASFQSARGFVFQEALLRNEFLGSHLLGRIRTSSR